MRNLEEDSKRAYEEIFNGRETIAFDDKSYRIRKTSKLGLRYLEVEHLTFIEQNPEKNSVWGRMAREGHKILWVIDDGDYVAQVRDGTFHDFNK